MVCTYPNTTGSGDVKQGVFDRVYAKYNGTTITEVIVVECKGGISPLGCRNGKKQGTRAYLLDIIENMRSKALNPSISTSQAFKDTAQLLFDLSNISTNFNAILKYYEVRQPFDKNGSLEDTKIKQFQL